MTLSIDWLVNNFSRCLDKCGCTATLKTPDEEYAFCLSHCEAFKLGDPCLKACACINGNTLSLPKPKPVVATDAA